MKLFLSAKKALFFISWACLGCVTNAVKCGEWYSSDCIGDDDIRYDKDYTSDLKELNKIWGRWEGYWVADITSNIRPSDNSDLLQPQAYNPSNGFRGLNRPYIMGKAFYNESFDGSRWTSNRYYVFDPATPEFCSRDLDAEAGINVSSPLLRNVTGSGTCGLNGYSIAAAVFGTTSYEKDGSISLLKLAGWYTAPGAPKPTGEYKPVDNFTVNSATKTGEIIESQTLVFLNNFNAMSGTKNVFWTSTQVNPHLESQIFKQAKVSRQEWLDAILQAYSDAQVLPQDRVQNGQLPMLTECIVDASCPTEAEWCTQDPECSDGPYQEPDGDLKPGPIIGIVLAGCLLIATIGVGYHFYAVRQARKRSQYQFATRIAQTIRLTPSSRQMTPEALAEEFKRIDKDNGGTISKSDLWTFMNSGKIGADMTEKDFNTLFAAIDHNHNGSVDFLEFCAFMGECMGDFDEVKNRRSVMESRESFLGKRGSMAEASARRLSSNISELKSVSEELNEDVLDEEDKHKEQPVS